MKRAAAADARRRVHRRQASESPVFNRISIKGANGFAEIQFEPRSSLFAICGATGVGKSTILDLISGALKPYRRGKRPLFRSHVGRPGVTVDIELASGEFSRQIEPERNDHNDGSGFKPEHRLVTLSERTEVLQSIFDEIDPTVAIEGVDARPFAKEDLVMISRVVGKRYDEIVCFEVEDPDFPDEIIPFFVAREGGLSYDLRNMGTGELSAIYITWILEYVKLWSILLLEEPEAMLPPMGHLNIFDIICVKASERNLAIVIATHSPDIVSAIPINQVLPLHRFDGVTSCDENPNKKNDALYQLGLRPPVTGLILLEDSLAVHVAAELISRFDLDLMRRVELRSVGSGFGAIKSALEIMPTFNNIKILGLLDGDMEDAAKKWGCKNYCCFLPFKLSMEAEFLEAVRRDISRFAIASGRDARRIEVGLQRADSLEPHDGYNDFRRATGLSEELCANFAFSQWLDLCDGRTRCFELLRQLRVKLSLL